MFGLVQQVGSKLVCICTLQGKCIILNMLRKNAVAFIYIFKLTQLKRILYIHYVHYNIFRPIL
jgi:hypothetical protein